MQMHANIVLGQDIAEYAALFSEIADAYFDRQMYTDAGHIYEMLGGDAGVRGYVSDTQCSLYILSYRQVVYMFCSRPLRVVG